MSYVANAFSLVWESIKSKVTSAQEQLGSAVAQKVAGEGIELTAEQQRKLASDVAMHMAVSLVPVPSPAEDLLLNFEAKGWTGSVSSCVVRLDEIAVDGFSYWLLDLSSGTSGFSIASLQINSIKVMSTTHVITASASVAEIRVEGGAPALVPYVGTAIGKVVTLWTGGSTSGLSELLKSSIASELAAIAKVSIGNVRITVAEIFTAGLDRLEGDTVVKVEAPTATIGPDIRLEGASVGAGVDTRAGAGAGFRISGFSGVVDGIAVSFDAVGSVEVKTLSGSVEVETFEISSIRIAKEGDPALIVDASLEIAGLSIGVAAKDPMSNLGKAIGKGLAMAVWETLKSVVSASSHDSAKNAFMAGFRTAAVSHVQSALVGIVRAQVKRITATVSAVTLDGSLEADAVLSVANAYLQAGYTRGAVTIRAGGEAVLALRGHAEATVKGIDAVVDGDSSIKGSVSDGVLEIATIDIAFRLERAEDPAIHAAGSLALRNLRLDVDAANESIVELVGTVLAKTAATVFAAQLPRIGEGPVLPGAADAARIALTRELEGGLPANLTASIRASVASVSVELREFTVAGLVDMSRGTAEVTDVSAAVGISAGAVDVSSPTGRLSVTVEAQGKMTTASAMKVAVHGDTAITGNVAEGFVEVEQLNAEFQIDNKRPALSIRGRVELENLALGVDNTRNSTLFAVVAGAVGAAADAAASECLADEEAIAAFPASAATAFGESLVAELEQRVPRELSTTLSARVRRAAIVVTQAYVHDVSISGSRQFNVTGAVELTGASVGIEIAEGAVAPRTSGELSIGGSFKGTLDGIALEVTGDAKPVVDIYEASVGIAELNITSFKAGKGGDPPFFAEGSLALRNLVLTSEASGSQIYQRIAEAIKEAVSAAVLALIGFRDSEEDTLQELVKNVFLDSLKATLPAQLGTIRARVGSVGLDLKSARSGTLEIGGGVSATDVQLSVNPGDLSALELDLEGEVNVYELLVKEKDKSLLQVQGLILNLDERGTGEVAGSIRLIGDGLREKLGGLTGKLAKALKPKGSELSLKVPIKDYKIQLSGLDLHGTMAGFIKKHLLSNIRVSSDGSLKVSSFKKRFVRITEAELGGDRRSGPSEQEILIPKNVPGGNAVNLQAFAQNIIQTRLDLILAGGWASPKDYLPQVDKNVVKEAAKLKGKVPKDIQAAYALDSNKTSARQNEMAAGERLTWWDAPRDGNCLFHCLARALNDGRNAGQLRQQLAAAIREGRGVFQEFYPIAEVRNAIADAVARNGSYTGLADSMVDYVTIPEDIRIRVVEEDGSVRMLGTGGGTVITLARAHNHFYLLE